MQLLSFQSSFVYYLPLYLLNKPNLFTVFNITLLFRDWVSKICLDNISGSDDIYASTFLNEGKILIVMQ